jgi:nucleotide-binding universal stress UspA family protein
VFSPGIPCLEAWGEVKFRRILAPLDGSPYAAEALPFAARIARASGAELLLVAVFDTGVLYPSYFGPVPLPQSTIDKQYAAFETYLRDLASRPELHGIAVRVSVVSGLTALTLLATSPVSAPTSQTTASTTRVAGFLCLFVCIVATCFL